MSPDFSVFVVAVGIFLVNNYEYSIDLSDDGLYFSDIMTFLNMRRFIEFLIFYFFFYLFFRD